MPGKHIDPDTGRQQMVTFGPHPDLMGVYCQKREVSGREKDESERDTAIAVTEFTLRYQPGINETMRFRCEGVEYDIVRVAEGEGRRQWTVLTCQKHN